MLGCQDFCGYYDWTFRYVARHHGAEAVQRLWADAIGGEAQAHYAQAAREQGLRGLYNTWTKTGQDEHCDWTFTLDEERNVLRWDMRDCPSKGFLLDNNLNACEDYCDHCMGWVIPLLDQVGVEVTGHEHNHCGQCWGEMSVKGLPHQALDLRMDIRRDPKWNRGYLDRWKEGRKLPLLEDALASSDPCDVLVEWFARSDHLVVLGRGPSASEPQARALPADSVLVTGTTYATRDVFTGDPVGVLIGDRSECVAGIARRFLATEPVRRPLLMHMYLPDREQVDFGSFQLPRPVPILPWLIRTGYYTHRPQEPYPTTGIFLVLLASSLGKAVDVAGIDNYQHPSGLAYADSSADDFQLPRRHSRLCDLDHLHRALDKATARVGLPLHLQQLLRQETPDDGSATGTAR